MIYKKALRTNQSLYGMKGKVAEPRADQDYLSMPASSQVLHRKRGTLQSEFTRSRNNVMRNSMSLEERKSYELKLIQDKRQQFKSYLQAIPSNTSNPINLTSNTQQSESVFKFTMPQRGQSMNGTRSSNFNINKGSVYKHIVLNNKSNEDIMQENTIGKVQAKNLDQGSDKELPYCYQVDPNDSAVVKEQKFTQRLDDLYQILNCNEVCILPDPKLKPTDMIPMFQIFTEDFRDKKKFRKFKNQYMAGDIKKESREFLADILRPQVVKFMNSNKDFTQSDSTKVDKSKLKELLRIQSKQKQSKRSEREQEEKNLDLTQMDSDARLWLKQRSEQLPSTIKTDRPRINDSVEIEEEQELLDDLPLDFSKTMDKTAPSRLPKGYQSSSLFQALKCMQNEESDQSKLVKIRTQWLKNKMKLDEKMIKSNQKQEVINQILDLIKGRDSPRPKSRCKEIFKKYSRDVKGFPKRASIDIREEMDQSSLYYKSPVKKEK